MNERINEIKEEVAELFAKNGIEDGLIHSTYKKYMEGEKSEGYTPYVDSRVEFKGVRTLRNLMKEFKEIKNNGYW